MVMSLAIVALVVVLVGTSLTPLLKLRPPLFLPLEMELVCLLVPAPPESDTTEPIVAAKA